MATKLATGRDETDTDAGCSKSAYTNNNSHISLFLQLMQELLPATAPVVSVLT